MNREKLVADVTKETVKALARDGITSDRIDWVRMEQVVEVAPGINVSKHLIDAAAPGGAEALPTRSSIERENDQLRADIDAGKQVIREMMERAKVPLNLQERYVSYDVMPVELQRVIRAYIGLDEARREFNEAIRAMQAVHT